MRAGVGVEDGGTVMKPQPSRSFFQVTDSWCSSCPFEGKEFSNRATKGTWPQSPAYRLEKKRSRTVILRDCLFDMTVGPLQKLYFKIFTFGSKAVWPIQDHLLKLNVKL